MPRALHTLPPPKRLDRRYWRFLKRRLRAIIRGHPSQGRPIHEGASSHWLTYRETADHYYEPAAEIVDDPRLIEKVAAYQRELNAFLAGHRPRRPLERVVFVVHVLHRVGGVLSIAQLVNDLIQLGVDVKVVVLNPDGFADDIDLAVEPIFFANRRDLVEHFPEADVVVGTLWATMYFIMHVYLRHRNFVPAYFVQDYEPDFYPDSDAVLRDWVARTYVMTPYSFAKTTWIRDRVGRHGVQVTVVPPAVDLDRFVPQDASANDTPPVVLAMLRPSTPRRDADTLLGVLSELHDRRKDGIAIHVFGSDAAALAELEIPFPYRNHGRVPNDALPELYSRAHLYLDCSAFHGFGRTVAEALACGTPCVVTASGGVEDFCVDGENCLLRPVGDVNALVDAVELLLDDEALYARLRGSARKSVAGFGRMHSARETLRFLESAWKAERLDGS